MKRNRRVISFLLMFCIIVAFVPVTFAQSGDTSLDASERLTDAVTLYVGSAHALVSNSDKIIDPSNTDVFPFIQNSRAMVPVRFLSESLGAQVAWDSSTQTVTVNQGGNVVKVVINNFIMAVNGAERSLDAPAIIKNSRTFLPIRAVAEALGKKLFYDRGLIIVSNVDNILSVASDKATIDSLIEKVNLIPSVGSKENLKTLLSKAYSSSQNSQIRYFSFGGKSAETASPVSASSLDQKSNDHSTTNVQVEGVDEADTAKTDGQYLYKVTNQSVVIAKAYPATDMAISSILDYKGTSFNPRELYLDTKRLIVIGSSYENIAGTETKPESIKKMPISGDPNISVDTAFMPSYGVTTVKAIIYDTTNPDKIVKLREVELEGDYISSRKINGTIYFIANKSIYRWGIYTPYYKSYMESTELAPSKGLEDSYEDTLMLPSYKDTVIGKGFVAVDYQKIRYFPDSLDANYLNIAALDIDQMNEPVKVDSYLGAGDKIYCSADNLYVTVNDYSGQQSVIGSPIIMAPRQIGTLKTRIYKFSLSGTKITFLYKGEVPGSILNQFSMDESGNTFRIATTVDEYGFSQSTSKNNLYILDETLKETGSLVNLAPGERIYSVRFIGQRAYMVTFRTVDPLFVIDLKDAQNPKVLGSLKIPGFSDYLHPYDENHIIGFGKDTVVMNNNAYSTGMKLALFDVTDVTNPKQQFTEMIGDRGTYSELLNNHKALLFSKDKNLLSFPVTVMETQGDKIDARAYGTFKFQGAYVYTIDLESGFKLKGKITHLTQAELNPPKYAYTDASSRYIERVLYIGDILYTLSNGIFKANDLKSMNEISAIKIP